MDNLFALLRYLGIFAFKQRDLINQIFITMKNLAKMLLAIFAILLVFTGCEKEIETPDDVPPSPPEVEVLSLTLTVDEITQSEAKLDIVASDQEAPFYYNIIEKSAFDTYEDEEEFLAADLSFLTQLAQQYDMTLTQLLAQELKSGNVEDWLYVGLSPNTAYYCYAYGITADAEVTTPVYKTEFTTLPVTAEDCTFEIQAEELTAATMILKITPSNENTAYYYDLLDANVYESLCGSKPEGIPAVVSEMIQIGVNEYGLTVQEAVARMTTVGEVTTDRFENLLPSTTYFAFAIGVGVDGTITTPAKVEAITTPAAENKFTINVVEVGADRVSIDIESESITESYAVITLPDDVVSDKSDEEILDLITNQYSEELHSTIGYMRYERIYLIPNTAYTAFVFGYVNGQPTTALNRITFTTTAPEFFGDLDFFRINPYKSSQECLWVSITPKRDDVSFYFDILPEETYQANGGNDEAIKKDIEAGIALYMQTFDCDRHEAILHLLHQGYQSPEGGTGEVLKPNTKYRIYAVGMYADGTLSTHIFSVEASTKGSFVPIEVTVEPIAGYEDTYCNVWFYPDAASTSKYVFRIFVNDASHATLSDEELREVVLAHNNNLGFTVNFNTATSQGVKCDVPNDVLSIYCFTYDLDGNPSPVQRLSWTKAGGVVDVAQ